MEKFPSGFFAYSGMHEKNFRDVYAEVKGEHHGLIDKLEKILKLPENNTKNIKCIKCFVKSSLWLVEQMDKILENEYLTTKAEGIFILNVPIS